MVLHKFFAAAELRQYMDSLIVHGIKLGLHNIQQLMAHEGNPHLRYPVVHVAGTNGKGSVLTFLNAILRKAGYRTGRFTSPHLISVNERFLIDDMPISDEELYEHLAALRCTAEKTEITPTYFEMNTAIAFRCFARHEVDIALVEVGMGGRFDSTNIVDPLACGITTIDYDHTQYLGDTLEQIAFEKAGILKKDAPAVTDLSQQAP
jgi:dihydrofolate synthase / folylpolyglutamate synthase